MNLRQAKAISCNIFRTTSMTALLMGGMKPELYERPDLIEMALVTDEKAEETENFLLVIASYR